MRLKKIIKNILAMACLIILFSPIFALAASPASENLNKVGSAGSNAPYKSISAGQNDLASIVGTVIEAFLGLLGVIFLVYIIYAGYNWLIAQGDEEKVTKAKETIQRAIVGLIIVIAAYAISVWVFDKLLTETNIVT